MASFNKVIILGNLTRDPELRRIASGAAVCAMRVAVNESFTAKSGEKVDRAIFLDVDAWDRQAETCAEFLKKGSSALIEGRLQEDSWEDTQTGEKRRILKIRADRVQFVSAGRQRQPQEQPEPPPPITDQPAANQTTKADAAGEELPF